MSEAPHHSGVTPERWLSVSVRFDSPLAAELLADALLSLGGRAVEEAEGRLITHLLPPDDAETFVREAKANLEKATGLRNVDVEWRWQPHEDWASLWKQGLGPRRISDRLVVTPSWCEPVDEAAAVVIVIDPGMAFGTAEHGTTRGALRLLDRALIPGQILLDAGCGSGILAIAAAGLGASRVTAVDLDPYACEAARENAIRNRACDRIDIENLAVTPAWLAERGRFDGILANIETGVLEPLLASFRTALGDGGWLILSGIQEGEWASMVRAASREAFSLERMDADGGWRSGWFTSG